MKKNAYAPDEKAKMALETLRGEGAVNEIASAYKSVGPDEEDLKIKRMIDELYTAHPEFGYRRMRVCSTKRKNWEFITRPSIGV